MHEMSIVENLFDIIDEISEENKLIKISKVIVQLGAMRAVIPESFQFAFDTIKKDTIAKDAKLIMELIPIKLHCRTCGVNSIVEDHVFFCPRCQSQDIEVIEGEDIIISSLEGDKE